MPWNMIVKDANGMIDDARFKRTTGTPSIEESAAFGAIAGSPLLAQGTPLAPSATSSGVVSQDIDSGNWVERSTGPSVTFATDFSGPNDFVSANINGGHVFEGPGESGFVVKDVTDGLSGGCCLRIDTPTTEGQNGADWMGPLDDSWTTNAESFGSAPFWIQFRFKIPASRLVSTNGSGAGWKWMNVAAYSPTNTSGQSFSNTLAEHVLQDNFSRGMPQAYHRDTGGSFPPFEEQGLDPLNPTEFSRQNAIDLGAPLTGGDRWCQGSGGGACEMWPTDEWMTFMVRIKPNTYQGTAGNEFDVWYARAGDTAWTHLITERDYDIGDPNSNGGGFTGINGFHLLNYETGRTSGNVDTHVKYDQVIVSTAEIAIPSDNGIGAGQSAMQVLADSMSSGDWEQMSPTGLGLFTGGNTSGITTYFAGDMHLDSVNGKIYWVGCDHATADVFTVYDYTTNAWTEEAQVPWGIGQGGTTSHGYDHGAFDSLRGKYYNTGEFTGRDLNRWTSGSTWENFDFSAFNSNASTTYAVEYFPEIDRVLILFNENSGSGQLIGFDPSDDTFEIIINQSTNIIDQTSNTHPVMSYNPTSALCVFGGGNDFNSVYKMDSTQTVTKLANAPVSYGCAQHARLFPNPTNGDWILIQDSSTWYDLDPSGSGTWTSRGGNADMLNSNLAGTPPAINSVIGCADRALGILVFVKAFNASSDAEMWLFKP